MSCCCSMMKLLHVIKSLARVPVVCTRPAVLPAVLPLDHPPIASNLVGKIRQVLNENVDGNVNQRTLNGPIPQGFVQKKLN